MRRNFLPEGLRKGCIKTKNKTDVDDKDIKEDSRSNSPTAMTTDSGSHAKVTEVAVGGIDVVIVPALKDNYMYLVIDRATKSAAAIDPVTPLDIMKEVKARNITLSASLTTHHHWDHSGGNKELSKLIPGLKIFGADDRVPAMTDLLKPGDVVNVGALKFKCELSSAHTKAHASYVTDGAVFTGDAMFLSGCGRTFEGTPELLLKALSALSALPENTQMFCGHDYARDNLRFAATVEPDNEHVKTKMEEVEAKKQRQEPTVPSTIGEEKLYNPFLRVHEKALREHTGQTEPVDVIRELRKLKDNFK